jgi:hypothetical protein
MAKEKSRRRSSWAAKRKAGLADAARPWVPRMPCPFCERSKLYLLPGGLGLVRCAECGYQGTPIASMHGRNYASLAAPGENVLVPVVDRIGAAQIIQMPYGDVAVAPDLEGNITATSGADALRITKDGRLVQADGVFCNAFVDADRPPPCPSCVSDDTSWVDFDAPRHAIEDKARALDRRVDALPCESRMLYVIEGYGGRTAKCRPCGGVVVYPTDPDFGIRTA